MKKIFLFTGCIFLLSACSIGKHEGRTAKEWFQLYDLQISKNESLKHIIENLENARDDLQIELDDMEDEKSTWENDYYDLESCVEDYPYSSYDNCL